MSATSSHRIIVGLTGQTGAGKSTVAKVFAESGFYPIDADRIAREVVEPGTPCLAELVDYFGEGILLPDGSLHRRALAALVFTDKKKLEVLNSITHPYITEEIFRRIHRCTEQGDTMILLDAPTLFESKASDFCDLIISVLADPALRMARIIARDGLTPEAARQRMAAQLDEAFFIRNSDHIIRNDADLADLTAQSREVAEKIYAYYQDHTAG